MSNFADFSLSTGRDEAGGRPHPCPVPVSSNGANISPVPIPIPGGSPIPVGAPWELLNKVKKRLIMFISVHAFKIYKS